MLTDSTTQPSPQSRVLLPMRPRKLLEVSPAEEKLLERLRSIREGTLVNLFVGGDGEPKVLFTQAVQMETLTR